MRVALPVFPIEGGCVCGAVRYRVKSAPIAVYACHCKDCQRFSGAGYSIAMAVQVSDFEVSQGDPARFAKPADSGRVVGVRFCRDCGTRLWHEPAHSPHLVILPPGTLDDSTWAKPATHIWMKRKLPWIEAEPGTQVIFDQPVTREPLHEAWLNSLDGL